MFYIKNIDIVKVPPLNLNPGIEFLNTHTDCTVYHDSMEINDARCLNTNFIVYVQ